MISPVPTATTKVFTENNNKNDFNTASRDEPLTGKAIDFLERMVQAGKPFYANIWGHSTHYPVKTDPEMVKETGGIPFNRADFADPIQERFDRSEEWKTDLKDSMTQYVAQIYGIDYNVGRIMKTLDRLGIAILVYSSDQGPQDENPKRDFAEHMLGYTGNLKGDKGTQWEGGVRVPFIIRWPGKVKAGRIDHESVTSFIDWLPTLSCIAGVNDLPPKLDGEDISDIWLRGPRDRTTDLYWRFSSGVAGISIREGKWKFHESKEGPQLFDLSKDEGEKINLAPENPEIVKRFKQTAGVRP